MSTEDLMMPRYLVIADYPENPLLVGVWVYVKKDDDGNNMLWENGFDCAIMHPEKYPHLFKKLEWWEERKPEEMPEYVKSDEAVFKHYGKGHTPVHLKVIDKEVGCDMNLMDLLPATQSEYLNQTK